MIRLADSSSIETPETELSWSLSCSRLAVVAVDSALALEVRLPT